MAQRLIIGLGTGRCGTVSLKALLACQADTHATHETMLLPHKFSELKLRQYMNKLWKRKEEVAADVALWTLPYVTAILGEYPSTKFICLKRDKEAVVKSFMRKTSDGRNHWTGFDSAHWDEKKWYREKKCPYKNCYPRFDADKEEALGLYWDYYYTVAETYEKSFPDSFRIFPLEYINSRDGCESILEFAGYEEMTIKVGIHKNRILT
jgi:hypothetical protein